MNRDPIVHPIDNQPYKSLAQEHKPEAFQNHVNQMFRNLSVIKSHSYDILFFLSEVFKY